MPALTPSSSTARTAGPAGAARAKLLRLLGAMLVTVALVPWLGVPAATATPGGKGAGQAVAEGNGVGDSSRAADKVEESDKATNAQKAAKPDKAAKGDQRELEQAPAAKGAKAGEVETSAKHDKSAKQKSATNGKAAAAGTRGERGRPQGGGAAKVAKPAGPKAVATTGSGTKATGTSASGTSAGGPGYQKVTLCHRTNSETNPYVRITVSVDSVVKASGHDGHAGPIHVPGMKAAGQRWGDVIPSFSYVTKSGSTATYGGKNWPAGQPLLERGCVASQPTTTPSQTPTPTPTPSDTPTTVTPTPTGSTGGPSLTPTNTTPPATETSVLPTKIPGPDDEDTGVLGTKVPLAHTGLDVPVGVLLALSLVLVLIGGAMIAGPSWNSAEQKRRH